ncbi:hypothetical protein QJ854_gp257 [Moumouvirus goulette]|uniref:Uncharacterized protein n=1 Tax=Moumouvirus goulette TaxID=1247379 RepID=M1NNA2_9VIRU|nr:hypothetical protein QJ854_gp257 [Moumouvirus goulette]AGF85525.1 hypothetical protein glt_00720 [Moumouvirus goulette]
MSKNKSIKKLYGIVLSNLQDNSYTAQKIVSTPNRIEKIPGCKISVYVHKYNKSPSKIIVKSDNYKNKKNNNSKTSKIMNKNKNKYNSKTSKIMNKNKKRGGKSYRSGYNCSKRKRIKPKRKSCNLKHKSKILQSNKKKLQNKYEGYYF